MTGENQTEQQAEPVAKRRISGCVRGAAGVFLLLVVVALLLPPVSPPREAARRVECNSHLKRIYIAMSSYRKKYGFYPPAYTVDKQGHPMRSWRVLLLEFLDHDLYTCYDFTQPWDSPNNLTLLVAMKSNGPYYCPTGVDGGQHDTSYVMLVGPMAFSDGPTARESKEITDDPATTIIVAEMSPSGIHWTEPRDLNVSEMSSGINDKGHFGIRSDHAAGAYVLCADGSVHSLTNNSMTETSLKSLTTINGKEDMSKFRPD